MPVRSRRLFLATGVGTSNVTAYTVPADRTAVLKTLSISNTAALANTLFLQSNASGSFQDYGAVAAIPGSGGLEVVNLFMVWHPGEVIRVRAANSGLNIYASGALLFGAPE